MALKINKRKTEAFVAPAASTDSKPATMILSDAIVKLKKLNAQIKGLQVTATKMKAEIATEARHKYYSHNLGRADGDVEKTIEVEDLEGNTAKVNFTSPKAVTSPAQIALLKDYLDEAYDEYVSESRSWDVHENLLPESAIREIEAVLGKYGVAPKVTALPSPSLKGLPCETPEDQEGLDQSFGWRSPRVTV